MPSAAGFTGIGKQTYDDFHELIALLSVAVFHHHPHAPSGMFWQQYGDGVTKNPTETQALFVWYPQPHEHDLAVN